MDEGGGGPFRCGRPGSVATQSPRGAEYRHGEFQCRRSPPAATWGPWWSLQPPECP